MSMPTRLTSVLEQYHVPYSAISHIPTYSAQYAAAVLHVPGKEVAKTVVLRDGKKTFLAVLPASYHINLKKLSASLGTPIGLLEEMKCNKLFPDCEPGAVPPFGELYGLPIVADESLAGDPEIIFCAGTHSEGIRMSYRDFAHLVKPRVCSFGEKS